MEQILSIHKEWQRAAPHHHAPKKSSQHSTTQTLPPLSLPAREGWNIVVDARRAYACSKVGTAACGRGDVVGLGLPGCSLLLHSFPHSHCSGSFAGSCVEDPCDVDIVCNGYGLLRIYCLALELHQGL